MNETLKNVAIVSGALIVGTGVGMTIDSETPIEPAPIVEEIVKEEVPVKEEVVKEAPIEEKAIFISMPEDKVKVQKWSEDSVNAVQSRIGQRKTSLEARRDQLLSDESQEAQDELININKELEMLGGAEVKMQIIEERVIDAQ